MANRSRTTADTRARILDAAVAVLAQTGLEALTMPAVAEQADVALRTVYNHFPSKEALAVAAYDRLAEASQHAVAELPSEGTPRDRVARFIEAFCTSLEHQSPGAAVIMATASIPEVDERIREVRAWRRQEIAAILRAAKREGTLCVPLEQGIALTFLATAYATWHSLTVESGLSPAVAIKLLQTTVDRKLFEHE
jgi:AcrR family transcriptional regulator